jgi:type II secretion system protein C
MRRALLAVFVAMGTFLLAHIINGVLENSIAYAVHPSATPSLFVQTEPDARSAESNFQSVRQDRQLLVRQILSSGLFPLPPKPVDPASPGRAAARLPPMNVGMKVAVLGVILGADGNHRAIIEELSNKKQGLYRVSQRISDVGELAAVEKDRVLFREGPQEEWLEMAIVKERAAAAARMDLLRLPRDMAVASLPVQSPPARRVLDRAQLIEVAEDPQLYLIEGRFQPYFGGPGKLLGFKVDGIRPSGVLEKSGLQNEDILASINGVEIQDPGKLWDIFKRLQHERTVRINVVRNNQPQTLFVEIRG